MRVILNLTSVLGWGINLNKSLLILFSDKKDTPAQLLKQSAALVADKGYELSSFPGTKTIFSCTFHYSAVYSFH